MERELVEFLICKWELRKQRLERVLVDWEKEDGITFRMNTEQRILDCDFFIKDLKDVWEVFS